MVASMSRLKNVFLLLFIIGLLPSTAWAHQPRLVQGGDIVINNPETSQAFYGELGGGPDVFYINSSKSFSLYISLLSPELPNSRKDFTAEILFKPFGGSSHKSLALLDGNKYSWQPYYEEFAGDSYFKGPDLAGGVLADAGEYTIKVSNAENNGKYVLVVGQKELFPPSEILKTLLLLPKLKLFYWQKPFYLIFWNKIGLFFGFTVFLAVFFVFLLVYFLKKRRHRGKQK